MAWCFSPLSSGCWDRESGCHWVWTRKCGSETSWSETSLSRSSSPSLSILPFISPLVERHVNLRWGSHLLARSTAAQALISAPQILCSFPPRVIWTSKWLLWCQTLRSWVRSLPFPARPLRFIVLASWRNLGTEYIYNVKYLLKTTQNYYTRLKF